MNSFLFTSLRSDYQSRCITNKAMYFTNMISSYKILAHHVLGAWYNYNISRGPFWFISALVVHKNLWYMDQVLQVLLNTSRPSVLIIFLLALSPRLSQPKLILKRSLSNSHLYCQMFHFLIIHL